MHSQLQTVRDCHKTQEMLYGMLSFLCVLARYLLHCIQECHLHISFKESFHKSGPIMVPCGTAILQQSYYDEYTINHSGHHRRILWSQKICVENLECLDQRPDKFWVILYCLRSKSASFTPQFPQIIISKQTNKNISCFSVKPVGIIATF